MSKDFEREYKTYLTNITDISLCIEELRKLRQERDELISLAESANPPQDIFERMEKSAIKFETLAQYSEEIKKNTKKQLKSFTKQDKKRN